MPILAVSWKVNDGLEDALKVNLQLQPLRGFWQICTMQTLLFPHRSFKNLFQISSWVKNTFLSSKGLFQKKFKQKASFKGMSFPLQKGKSFCASTRSITWEAEIHVLPSSSATPEHLACPLCYLRHLLRPSMSHSELTKPEGDRCIYLFKGENPSRGYRKTCASAADYWFICLILKKPF